MKPSILLLIAMLLAVTLVPCEASHNRKLKSRSRHHIIQLYGDSADNPPVYDAAYKRQQQLKEINYLKYTVAAFQRDIQKYEAIVGKKDSLKKQIKQLFGQNKQLTRVQFQLACRDHVEDPLRQILADFRIDQNDGGSSGLLNSDQMLVYITSCLNRRILQSTQQMQQFQEMLNQLQNKFNSSQ